LLLPQPVHLVVSHKKIHHIWYQIVADDVTSP
jgi:hypothetical protein